MCFIRKRAHVDAQRQRGAVVEHEAERVLLAVCGGVSVAAQVQQRAVEHAQRAEEILVLGGNGGEQPDK